MSAANDESRSNGRKVKKYPGLEEAERERKRKVICDEEPDFIAGSPNYDKFKRYSPEEVLVWLNID